MTNREVAVEALRRVSEKRVQREVVKVLQLHQYVVDDFSQPRASMQTPGIPDLRARNAARRIRFWVEVKRPGGRLSPAQEAWHELERAAGGTVFVVGSAAEMHEEVTKLHLGTPR